MNAQAHGETSTDAKANQNDRGPGALSQDEATLSDKEVNEIIDRVSTFG